MAIDLLKFCGTDEFVRPYLMKPFNHGDFTYATNGHICVRVAALPEFANPDAKCPVATAEKLFKNEVDSFSPLPSIGFPEIDEYDVCEECDGDGVEHECPDCDCACQACDGSGRPNPFWEVSVGIGNGIYAGRYIGLIQSLPDIEIGPTSSTEPLRFRFAGGEGALMPRRVQHAQHIVAGAISQEVAA